MKGQEMKGNEFEKSLYLNFIWTENLMKEEVLMFI